MRKIRAHFELTKTGIAVDRRYVIVVGDGSHSQSFVLGPQDQFSRAEWEFLVGPTQQSIEWHSDTNEGMYVTISRQYVNPNFDFTQEGYLRQDWLIGLPEVSQFRLYNPFIGRPFISWPINHSSWGNNDPFSEGDEKQFEWSVTDWETKIDEQHVKYTVKRLDDSDDYKEFLISLD